MGLGLPDGGHLTHGYYVSLTCGVPFTFMATEIFPNFFSRPLRRR